MRKNLETEANEPKLVKVNPVRFILEPGYDIQKMEEFLKIRNTPFIPRVLAFSVLAIPNAFRMGAYAGIVCASYHYLSKLF